MSDGFFIAKNIEGFAIPCVLEGILELIFNGNNLKTISKRINEINENNTLYKKQLEKTQNSVESLSESYKENLSFDKIKENLNTSIIHTNSMLIDLKTTLVNHLNDNIFNSSEKANIDYKLDDLNNQMIEMLGYADAMIDIIFENGEETNTITVSEGRLALEKAISDLIIEIQVITKSNEENISLSDISAIESDISGLLVLLSSFKTSCDETLLAGTSNDKTLGACGTISDEIYSANNRIDNLLTNFSELQSTLINSLEKEKQQVQSYFDEDQAISNKMLPITNSLSYGEGTLSKSQFQTLDSYANAMINCLSKIESSYKSYYGNDKLDENNKKLLKETFDIFEEKHTNFTNSIKVDMVDLIYTKEERKRFSVRLAEYRDARSILNSQILNCINVINNESNSTNLQQIEQRLNDKIVTLQNDISSITKRLSSLETKVTEIEDKLNSTT